MAGDEELPERKKTPAEEAAAKQGELHARSLTLGSDLKGAVAEARATYRRAQDRGELDDRVRHFAEPLFVALDLAVEVIDFQLKRIQALRRELDTLKAGGRPRRG